MMWLSLVAAKTRAALGCGDPGMAPKYCMGYWDRFCFPSSALSFQDICVEETDALEPQRRDHELL